MCETDRKADVDVAVFEDWKEQLPTLLEGYNLCDMFKGFIRYKTITSQIVSSEAQVKNFFLLKKSDFHFSFFFEKMNREQLKIAKVNY